MNQNCTTIRNASIREAVWQLHQTLDAQDRQAKADAERTADIASHYAFTPNDLETFLTADNQPLQLAMDMTEVFTGRVRTVVCRVEEGRWVWLVENMAGSPVSAWDLIACVRQRIGARLACQLTGKVTVN